MRAGSRTQFAVGALSSQDPRIVFRIEIFQTERADGRHQRDVRISANESGKRKSSASARPASSPSTGYVAASHAMTHQLCCRRMRRNGIFGC
jgi:hypothetical protein